MRERRHVTPLVFERQVVPAWVEPLRELRVAPDGHPLALAVFADAVAQGLDLQSGEVGEETDAVLEARARLEQVDGAINERTSHADWCDEEPEVVADSSSFDFASACTELAAPALLSRDAFMSANWHGRAVW